MNIHTRAVAMLLALMLLIGMFSVSASAESGAVVYGIGFVNASGLNLRQSATTDSPSLGTANSGECVVILGQEENWYHVNYNMQEGYMSSEYLNVSTAENAELGYGIVNGSSVNLRKGPGVSFDKVGTASYGEKLYIIGLNNGWYKILRDSGSCYIYSEYLNLSEIPYENRASNNTPRYFRGGKAIGTLPSSAASSVSTAAVSSYQGAASGSAILAKAQQYLGTPYVYGGASPAGFDCSGFVYYVYGTFGISVGRTPDSQRNAGRMVDKSSLQVGDIVLFGSASSITHTGIYAGNGQFIHSPNSRSTVSYSDLTTGYWSEHFYSGVRVV